MLTYALLQDRIEQFLQDTSAATYTTTITGMWIEEGLKEFSTYLPNIVPVVFKIESRTGRDVTGTASSLTDLVKLQFVAADATDEKVVHNTTDNTWAVVLANSSTSVNTLSADIMDADEEYAIYNKRCWNEKQIYIGDVTDYLWIDSVEYPLGTKRNFEVYGEVLELDVDAVEDSDSSLDPPENIDVLVRFAKPHRLCQLADLAGAVHTAGTVDGKTQQVKDFTNAQIAEIGDEFTIANHRTIYTLTAVTTFASQDSTGSTLTFFPGLEAVTVAADIVTFTQSTLQPQHEELLYQLVASKALISDANAQLIQAKADTTTGRALINTIPKGGAAVVTAYLSYASAEQGLARRQETKGLEMYSIVLSNLKRLRPWNTNQALPKD